MSRRIDIELTSALDGGSWTWRAAGARKPSGVVDGAVLPPTARVGDEFKVEVEQMLEGIEIVSVVKHRGKSGRTEVLEILPSSEPFEAVIETRARRERTGGAKRSGDRDRPPRNRDSRDRDSRDRDSRDRDSKDRDSRDRDKRNDRRRVDGAAGAGNDASPRPPRRRDRPHHEAPPELPQRPKPKRLRPGKARRNAVLADIPDEQRAVAEVATQGMAAVRARVKDDNVQLVATGQPAMPEASVLKMAEELLPRLRVADWLDRAEAAKRQIEHLDLRDLRSVIAAGDDSIVARDETARALLIELKVLLAQRQEADLQVWIADIEAALGVGRVIRALRLSSQPPKAGVMFPPDLARRLGEAATKALQPDDTADRWIAVLEAAAFAPVRSLVKPEQPPTTVSDDLRATVRRLGPAMPQIAQLLAIEIPAGAHQPKPLRQTGRPDAKRQPAKRAPRPAEVPARASEVPTAVPAGASDAPAEAPTEATDAPAEAPTGASDASAEASDAPADAPAEAPTEATEVPTEAIPDNAEAPVEHAPAAVEEPAVNASSDTA